MSYTGWLSKRLTAYGGAMEKRYCVLVGALMLDYEQKEHFLCGMPPKAEMEIIGVSNWNGKGNSHAYEHAFVYVTRLGGTHYCQAASEMAKEGWMNQMMVSLELALELSNIAGIGPGGGLGSPPSTSPRRASPLRRGVLEPPAARDSDTCMKSGQPFGMTQSRYSCCSCGQACLLDFCNKSLPLTHHGFEQAVRVCDDCFVAQQHLNHLKYMTSMFEAHLYEHRLARKGLRSSPGARGGARSPTMQFQAPSLQMGLRLLDSGSISETDFSELVKAEQRYQRDEAANRVHSARMQVLLGVGDDMLGLIKLLHDSAQSERFNVHEFQFIVAYLHDLADKDLDSIDFFWPQVVHTHYLLIPAVGSDGILKAELLEDFMLAMCLKSVHLAVKLIWWLRGYLEDLAGTAMGAVGGPPLEGEGDALGKQAYLIRLALEVEETVLTRQSRGAGRARVEKGVFKSLLRPTGAQSSLIADQLLMLQHLRKAMVFEFYLSYKAKLRMLDFERPESAEGGGTAGDAEEESAGALAARYFEEQLQFVQTLGDIAENLRFTEPVTRRGAQLKADLQRIEGELPDTAASNHGTVDGRYSPKLAGSPPPSLKDRAVRRRGARMPGYLPVCRASDPICRIVRIPADEGYVFKTKMRAPTLIACEIISPDKDPVQQSYPEGPPAPPSLEEPPPMELSEAPIPALSPILHRLTLSAPPRASGGPAPSSGASTPTSPGSRRTPRRRPSSDKADVEKIIDGHVGGVGPEGLKRTFSNLEGPQGGGQGLRSRPSARDWQSKGSQLPGVAEGAGSSDHERQHFGPRPGSRSADSSPRLVIPPPLPPPWGDHSAVSPSSPRKTPLQQALSDNMYVEVFQSLGYSLEETGSVVGNCIPVEGSPPRLREPHGRWGGDRGGRQRSASPLSAPRGTGRTRAELLSSRKGVHASPMKNSPRHRSSIAHTPQGQADAGPKPRVNHVTRKSWVSDGTAEGTRMVNSHSTPDLASMEGQRGGGGGSSGPRTQPQPSQGAAGLQLGDVVDVLMEHSVRHPGILKDSRSMSPRRDGRRHTDHNWHRSQTTPGHGRQPLSYSEHGPTRARTADQPSRRSPPVPQRPEAAPKVESQAVIQARELFTAGVITQDELDAVVTKDQEFHEAIEEHEYLDVQFCVSLAFGESWASKKARIKAESPEGHKPGWDLVSIIVKSNDDLRQEVCAIQLIELCRRIFQEAQLDLWLQPYLIISTGASTGLLQALTDAISLDSLKKKPGFVSLRQHFESTYGAQSQRQFAEARKNFVNSLAAYSVACYVLQIKDRHNGNILLDTAGHLIHIDFGFILGIAPGGSFSLESCPFKLTAEFVDVMGGLDSQVFMDFVVAFTCGFLTLQSQTDRIVTLVEILTRKSPFPCFQGKDTATILRKVRSRLVPHLNKSDTVAHCLDLIRESYNNYNTRQYDNFQYFSNGIMP